MSLAATCVWSPLPITLGNRQFCCEGLGTRRRTCRDMLGGSLKDIGPGGSELGNPGQRGRESGNENRQNHVAFLLLSAADNRVRSPNGRDAASTLKNL